LPATRAGAASAALVEDHRLLVAAVAEAARLAASFAGKPLKSWDKRPGQPVTEADMAVDALLHERLAKARPGYGWLSEESEDDPARLDREFLWLVDPIDGTRALIRGRPEYTVTAALVRGGRPIAAAVANPATGEHFEALAGGGARLDGKPLRVTGCAGLRGARILSSRGEAERRDWPVLLPGAVMSAISSIAYKIALVATARFDAAVTLWPKSEWDIAAADLIVQEAGGLVTTATGGPLVYNKPIPHLPSVVAAAPSLHAPLIAALR
jgi:myo-inositol-1(or 4)-monophosphatase